MISDIRLVLESFKNQETTDIEYEINEAFRYFAKTERMLVSEEAQELCSKGQMEEALRFCLSYPSTESDWVAAQFWMPKMKKLMPCFNDVEERLIQLPGEWVS